jgi:hypothetical protein
MNGAFMGTGCLQSVGFENGLVISLSGGLPSGRLVDAIGMAPMGKILERRLDAALWAESEELRGRMTTIDIVVILIVIALIWIATLLSRVAYCVDAIADRVSVLSREHDDRYSAKGLKAVKDSLDARTKDA